MDDILTQPSRNVPTGRFAPSPSGRMHLGNIAAAYASYMSVKQRGGRWILRIEDLDPGRSRMEWAKWIEDDLHWLGLDWDEGGLDGLGDAGPYLQSRRDAFYAEALSRLENLGLVYPCYCTRADIMASRAPHVSDGRVVYPGTCRPAPGKEVAVRPGARPALRVAVPGRDIEFADRLQGSRSVNLSRDWGDFIVRRSDGAWAYQLAVTVDDALMGVTEVVRGLDLLDSSACQIYLYELLGWTPPEFSHIPLLVNEYGQRLSKRDASLSMAELRKRHSPGEVLAMTRVDSVPL